MGAHRSTTDVASDIGALPGDDVVVFHTETPWAVPWALLMLGPSSRCVLEDTDGFRLVTASAMLRSALREASALGWDAAIVIGGVPRLITSHCVFRSLLGAHERRAFAAATTR
jgi:hypothetical protein